MDKTIHKVRAMPNVKSIVSENIKICVEDLPSFTKFFNDVAGELVDLVEQSMGKAGVLVMAPFKHSIEQPGDDVNDCLRLDYDITLCHSNEIYNGGGICSQVNLEAAIFDDEILWEEEEVAAHIIKELEFIAYRMRLKLAKEGGQDMMDEIDKDFPHPKEKPRAD